MTLRISGFQQAISAAFILLMTCIFLIKQGLVVGDEMSLAISIDLVVVIPLIYFLMIRTTKISNKTTLPIMIVGLIIGYTFLPLDQQWALSYFREYVLPIIEIAVLIYVIIEARRTRNEFRRIRQDLDFFDSLVLVTSKLLPQRLVRPFAMEIGMIYYGIFNWRKRDLSDQEFSYHKETGTQALFAAIIFVIAIETVVIHILLNLWNPLVAWIVTGISIYTAFQFFGIARSISKRPITIRNGRLVLRFGIMNDVNLSLASIQEIEKITKPVEDKSVRYLSPFDEMEGHNILITLKSEATLNGLYGIKKKFNRIALHVDRPEDLIAKIQQAD